MGVVNHEVVIATTQIKKALNQLLIVVANNFPNQCRDLLKIIHSPLNDTVTIFFAPSGSKVGWPDDEFYKKWQENFIAAMESMRYSDGSSPFYWVKVGYGEFGQKVLAGNCYNKYTEEDYYEPPKEVEDGVN